MADQTSQSPAIPQQQSSADSATPGLLGLPAELRLEIYHHLIRDHSAPIHIKDGIFGVAAALTLTWAKVGREVTPVARAYVYDVATHFRVTVVDYNFDKLRHFFENFTPTSINVNRSISITLMYGVTTYRPPVKKLEHFLRFCREANSPAKDWNRVYKAAIIWDEVDEHNRTYSAARSDLEVTGLGPLMHYEGWEIWEAIKKEINKEELIRQTLVVVRGQE
jgi:hypothetical protein